MREKLNYAVVFALLLVLAFGSYQLYLIALELQEIKGWFEYYNLTIGKEQIELYN